MRPRPGACLPSAAGGDIETNYNAPALANETKTLGIETMSRRKPARRRVERRKHRSGDACELSDCGGFLRIYTSFVQGENRVRYLECGLCGDKPAFNKQFLPLTDAERARLATTQ